MVLVEHTMTGLNALIEQPVQLTDQWLKCIVKDKGVLIKEPSLLDFPIPPLSSFDSLQTSNQSTHGKSPIKSA